MEKRKSKLREAQMSYKNFRKAMELAPKCKFYTTAGGKTKEEILMSENILGLSFSPQCKEFYEMYGYLSFYGNEIYGIDPEDDPHIPCSRSKLLAIISMLNKMLPPFPINVAPFTGLVITPSSTK